MYIKHQSSGFALATLQDLHTLTLSSGLERNYSAVGSSSIVTVIFHIYLITLIPSLHDI